MGAADFSGKAVCVEKPARSLEEVIEEAKAGRQEKPEDWFAGQESEEDEEEKWRRLRLMQETSGNQVQTSSHRR